MQKLTDATTHALIEHLAAFVSTNKKNKIESRLDQRTRHLTTVFENVFQPHNAAAALRSCECFGIQEAHIIERGHDFKPNSDVVQGSTKWLDIKRYPHRNPNNLTECIHDLKNADYQIVVTTLSGQSVPVQDLDIQKKTALCFGTEQYGISPELHELSDVHMHIPMHGFTQSFNISVSVALTLYELTNRLRQSDIDWKLSEQERLKLKCEWYIKSAQNGKAIAERYLAAMNLNESK